MYDECKLRADRYMTCVLLYLDVHYHTLTCVFMHSDVRRLTIMCVIVHHTFSDVALLTIMQLKFYSGLERYILVVSRSEKQLASQDAGMS